MTRADVTRALGPARSLIKRAGCAFLDIRTCLVQESGAVALTFDDGPDADYTPAVLDMLADFGVSATFFCVGHRVERNPQLVARMLAEGHTVGSHSQSHDSPQKLSLRARVADFRAGRRAIERVSGQPCSLFRPPQGYLAGNTMLAIAVSGLRPWLWTIDTEDWHPGMPATSIVAAALRAEAGSVLLLHDGLELPRAPDALNRSATVEALPVIIEALHQRGLRFATLPS